MLCSVLLKDLLSLLVIWNKVMYGIILVMSFIICLLLLKICLKMLCEVMSIIKIKVFVIVLRMVVEWVVWVVFFELCVLRRFLIFVEVVMLRLNGIVLMIWFVVMMMDCVVRGIVFRWFVVSVMILKVYYFVLICIMFMSVRWVKGFMWEMVFWMLMFF